MSSYCQKLKEWAPTKTLTVFLISILLFFATIPKLPLSNEPLSSEDTPRRTKKGERERESSLLTSTPDKRESAEMQRRLSFSRAVKQDSRQLQDDDEMENADQSILSKSLIINNNNTSRFDDKPEHLYGLDNPADISSDKPEVEQKNNENGQTKPANKFFYKYSTILLACLFCLLVVLMGIYNNPHNQKQQHEEDEAVFRHAITKRLSKVEQILSNQGIKPNQDHTFQRVFLRDKSTHDVQQFEELIEQAFRRWDADKISLPDYALQSTGGQIHSSYHSATFANGAPQVLVFGIPLWYDVKPPSVIIQPGNNPGECWAFQGSSGFVVIKLSQMIKPSSFTLEHMAASLSQFGDHSIPSAPKEFSVWGWSDAHGNEKTLLGEYVYDHKGHALQSFPVQATTVPEFRFIELKVNSNYGNPSYTCLYRFRVHGTPHRNDN